MNTREVFKCNLNRYIELSGKSKKEISESIPIPYTTLVDWTNGNKFPRADGIEKLANYFKILKSDLLEEKPLHDDEVIINISDKNLGERVRLRREELNLSQEELAKRMKYKSRSSINKIELGINDISQSKIALLAEALQVTPAYIMGWDENDEQNSSATLSSKEITHIKLYRKLNDLGKKRVDDYMNDISEVSGYLYNEEDNRSTPYIAAHDGKIKKSKKISLKTAKKLNNQ